MKTKSARLTRERHTMPGNMRQAIKDEGLWDVYKDRPAYQQNDYVGWIKQAKLEATKEKRLKKMVSELRDGGMYMGMRWRRK